MVGHHSSQPDRSDLDAGIRWGAAENIAQLGEVEPKTGRKTSIFFFFWGERCQANIIVWRREEVGG